jgi:hypothetical protein
VTTRRWPVGLSAEELSLRARAGAHALHAKYDSRELTANGRAKFLQRFVNEVDPDRVLPEAERLRRAEHALRSYMARLALRSVKARRKAAGSG